jgi:glycosyltransferase involved in cell wall biosynthesis
MRLLFAYSANFKKDEFGDYYTGGSIKEEMWSRYTSISDELNIISRLDKCIYKKEQAMKNFNSFDDSNKNFTPIPNLRSGIIDFFNIKKRTEFSKSIKVNVINNDFIIARLPSNVGSASIKYARKYKKPYLVEVVGCPWDAYWNHSLKGKLIAPFMYWITKKNVKNADYVLYVTNKFLQQRYPSKGKTLGCSDVALPPLSIEVLEQRLNKIKQMSDDKPIVIGTTAAVDVRYKGQEYVIRAISKLNSEGYNFEYHLAGGGNSNYLTYVAEKFNVADKVKFMGSLPHEEVFAYLDNIDIYIQPSKLEGLPRALIEAMSRGCPSIGSDVGGIPELLNEDFIFHNGSIDEICCLLKKMRRNVMIKEAKRSFHKAKEFDGQLLNDRRTAFYREFSKKVNNKI